MDKKQILEGNQNQWGVFYNGVLNYWHKDYSKACTVASNWTLSGGTVWLLEIDKNGTPIENHMENQKKKPAENFSVQINKAMGLCFKNLK